MHPEIWNRVERLFLATVDLPPDERTRFLDLECAGDPKLRDEIESLLDSDRKNGESIAVAVESEAALMLDTPAAADRIGPYRVVKEIGRGGMGAVYLAARADDEDRKQVDRKRTRLKS